MNPHFFFLIIFVCIASFHQAYPISGYVVNQSDNSVHVIDVDKSTVTNTISVGISPQNIAITPDGTKGYVGNTGDDNISVIDILTNTVVRTIPVGGYPVGVAITPDGTKAYVANSKDNTVSVIHVQEDKVIETIPVGKNPQILAITPDGKKAYVTNNADASVSVIDLMGNQVVETIAVGSSPWNIAITPDGSKAFVANSLDDNVSVIDIATNKVISIITMTLPQLKPFAGVPLVEGITKPIVETSIPENLDIAEAEETTLGEDQSISEVIGFEEILEDEFNETENFETFVESENDKEIARLPEVTLEKKILESVSTAMIPDIKMKEVPLELDEEIDESKIISLGTIAPKSGITPDGTKAYVANHEENVVNVIDVETNDVISTIPVGHIPQRSVITPDGTKAYVTNSQDNTISVIDTKTNTVLTTIPVGKAPWGIAFAPPPPLKVEIRAKKNVFLTQTDFFNVIQWDPPHNSLNPVKYKIYRNPELTNYITTVYAHQTLFFADHNLKKNTLHRYYIVAESETGILGIGTKIVKTKH